MRLLAMLVVLFTALFAPTPAPASRPVAEPSHRRSRHAAPDLAPQARRVPPRIPNYPQFAEVAVRHAPLWEVVYEHGIVVPYTARNRVTGHLVAVSDVDLLDHVLTEYQPPHTVRAYCDRGRVRAYAPSGG